MARTIEITGVPGAGKSTVTDNLLERNPARSELIDLETGYWQILADLHYVPQSSIVRRKVSPSILKQLRSASGWRAHATLCFQGLYPEFQTTVGTYIKKYTQDRERQQWAIQSILTLQERFWTVTAEADYDNILLEQGFIDKARSIFAPPSPDHRLEMADVERYARLVPKPDLLIVIEADTETAIKRIKRRTEGPPEQYVHLQESALRSSLDRMQRTMSSLIGELEDHGVECILIDNNGSLEELYSQVATLNIGGLTT